mgnify:FL=1
MILYTIMSSQEAEKKTLEEMMEDIPDDMIKAMIKSLTMKDFFLTEPFFDTEEYITECGIDVQARLRVPKKFQKYYWRVYVPRVKPTPKGNKWYEIYIPLIWGVH